MGRLGDAIDQAAKPHGPTCGVGAILETMDPDDAADLVAYLKGRVPTTVIRSELARLGIDVNITSLRRHRHKLRGEEDGCACRV